MELVIRNLTKQYPNKLAVDGVNLTLRPGVYGLLGANGAGKTTLMRMLCGILHPTGGGITLDGLTVDQEDYRASLGYLPQDFGYYPGFTGMDFLLYLGALKGLPRPQAKARAAELLDLVGLSEVAKRKLKTYSGGMKQRVVIAIALACNPKLLIADEPTTALDVTIQAQILDIMRRLKGSSGSLMLITHNLGIVADICEEVVVMYAGRAIERGTLKAIFDNPLHPYTQGLMASVPTMRSEKKPLYTIPGTVPTVYDFKEGCRFADRCQHCTEECRTKIPPVKRVGEDHIVQCWMNFEGEEPYHE